MSGFIDFAIALLLALLSGFVIRQAGLSTFDRLVAAFEQLVGGWRGEGWPRGVQEEDRDRPWGRSSQAHESAPEPAPPVSRVQPSVRVRG